MESTLPCRLLVFRVYAFFCTQESSGTGRSVLWTMEDPVVTRSRHLRPTLGRHRPVVGRGHLMPLLVRSG